MNRTSPVDRRDIGHATFLFDDEAEYYWSNRGEISNVNELPGAPFEKREMTTLRAGIATLKFVDGKAQMRRLLCFKSVQCTPYY